MRRDSRALRWSVLGCVWSAILALLLLHAVAVRDYLVAVDALGRRDAPTPVAVTSPYSATDVDGREWLRHAQALLEGGQWRIRHTNSDNAPSGREVHWNSGWAWLLAGSGWAWHRATGDPIAESLAQASVWVSPLVLFAFVVLLSGYVARRVSTAAGALTAVAMVGHTHFATEFSPGYADHHGLALALIFAMLLGAVFSGGGWWSASEDGKPRVVPSTPGDARRAAVVSAVAGAAAMWVSAASAIPAIAIICVAGIVAAIAATRGPHRHALAFDPQVWRLWGRTGAAVSIGFYVLEYFPGHLALHLEVNHPLHALAWLGAGELVADVVQRMAGASSIAARPMRVAGFGALIVAPLAVVAMVGADAFAPLDPFLARLHASYIAEFAPAFPTFADLGVEYALVAAAVAALLVFRRDVPPTAWMAAAAALLWTVLGWTQNRWLDIASGPQVLLIVMAVVVASHARGRSWRWALPTMVGFVAFVPAVSAVSAIRADARAMRVGTLDATLMLYRDVAGSIRASQPSGDVVLLATPHASPHLAYFGGFGTLGSFYWENAEGLKTAAAVFTAPSAEAAAELIRERRVTHIAMMSHDDFVASYADLLHPGARASDVARTFGHRLLHEYDVPQWLQWIPYRAPSDLAMLDTKVLLFRVAFDQTAEEALYHAARGKLALGETALAERDADRAIATYPDAYLPWMLRSEIRFGRQDWDGAVRDAIQGIARAPEPSRARITSSVANGLLASRQTGSAIRVYRASLQKTFDAGNACDLAFQLSTASNESLRNGAEAVGLARRALAVDPDAPRHLICLTAALAEERDFTGAATTVERALLAARGRGDPNAGYVAEELLQSFRAGEPWRQ